MEPAAIVYTHLLAVDGKLGCVSNFPPGPAEVPIHTGVVFCNTGSNLRSVISFIGKSFEL